MIFRTPQIGTPEQLALEKIDEIRQGLKHALQTPKRWTGFLRRNLLARAIQGSNSIEGYNVTIDEAVAVVEREEVDTDSETRAALEGYRMALTYVMQLSDDRHFVLNEELIRGLHYMMLSYDVTKNPGRWRPGPIFVRREPSGERMYEGPDAEAVPALMRELIEAVAVHPPPGHVVVRAAMAHLNLVMIHPFSDGNGRMGRALQTLVLARDGILSPPFSSIEEYLGAKSNTDAYYDVLRTVGAGTWQPERDATPWLKFCLMAHLQQALTVARRMREYARLWSELEAELGRRKLDERMIDALYEAALGFRVRSARYRAAAEISNQVAAKDLRALVQHGLLVPKGEKKGRTYAAAPRADCHPRWDPRAQGIDGGGPAGTAQPAAVSARARSASAAGRVWHNRPRGPTIRAGGRP